MKIDINCDVGEGVANEHLIIPFISSCNIACGGHFGDANTIDKTLDLAIKHKVKIGAHPSFPDKKNFGRKLMQISDEEFEKSIQHQLDLFLECLHKKNQQLHHIKPHGALYNEISVNKNLAQLFVKTINTYLGEAYLYVPFQSEIEKVALKENVNIKYEAFADRNYTNDLKLVSRANENALITNTDEITNRIFKLVKDKTLKSIFGEELNVKADTVCIHSDTENAIDIAKELHANLINKGISIGF